MKKSNNTPKLRFPQFTRDWELKAVKDIVIRHTNPVEVEPEKIYQEIGIRSHGKGIFHKEPKSGKLLGNKRVFWIKDNAFIVNIVFAWEQAVAKTSSEEIGMIASHRFPMYVPKRGIADLDFLLHFFLTKKGKLLLEMASPGGAGRNKTLGQKEFENLKFQIPSEIEQNKIAAFLSSLDAKIKQLTKKKELFEQYNRGVSDKIFKQEIKFKDKNGSHYPKWAEKNLAEIGQTYNGLTGKTKVHFGKGKRFITYKQVFDNSRIDLSKCGQVQISKDESQNKVIFGDIIFTTSSETPHEVGMSSVFLDNVDDVYLNSFCFGFRPNSLTELCPEFAQHSFRSSLFREAVIKLAQGSTRYNMSKNELMKIKIKLPCQAEQKVIAAFLNQLQYAVECVTNEIEQTKQFKKAVIQKMFV